MEITIFYIPVGSSKEASSLGDMAIEKHLAACSNIFPVQSGFVWEEKMQQEQEFVLLLKTFPTLRERLRIFISSVHSYKTPAILSWQVEVNDEYGKWMSDQLKM